MEQNEDNTKWIESYENQLSGLIFSLLSCVHQIWKLLIWVGEWERSYPSSVSMPTMGMANLSIDFAI